MGMVTRTGRERHRASVNAGARGLLFACLWAAPSRVVAQSPTPGPLIIRGRVIDDQSRAPLGSVLIRVSRGADTLGQAVTDADGTFRIGSVGAAGVVLSFRRLGYEPGTVAVDSLDACGVYFGTTGGQVYASANGGDSWNAIVRDLPAVVSVEVQTLP